MKSAAFFPGIERALQTAGFARQGKVLVRRAAEAVTLIDHQRGFGDQLFINVGFWVLPLGGDGHPQKVEHTHLYYRLEGLVPECRDVILAAGALADRDQQEGYERLLDALRGPIDLRLRELDTVAGLRNAMATGSLSRGPITWEARAFLTADHRP